MQAVSLSSQTSKSSQLSKFQITVLNSTFKKVDSTGGNSLVCTVFPMHSCVHVHLLTCAHMHMNIYKHVNTHRCCVDLFI